MKAKFVDLLRQARVHVVEVRHAEHAGEDDADEAAFLVRVDGVVALAQRAADRRQREREVERHLAPRTVRSGRRARTAAAGSGRTRSPGIATSWPNGYVTRSTVCPSSSSARMRWYSLNGVPRGSKNGSGAIIRMCISGEYLRIVRDLGSPGQRKSRNLREFRGMLGRMLGDPLRGASRARIAAFPSSKRRQRGAARRAFSRASMSPACGSWRERRRSAWLASALALYLADDRSSAPGGGACCSTRRRLHFPLRPADVLVPRRDVLQQLPAEQHRRRRHPHRRHGAGRRLEDAARRRSSSSIAGSACSAWSSSPPSARRSPRGCSDGDRARSARGMLWLGFAAAPRARGARAADAATAFGRLLQPLRVLHPEWVDERI